MLKTRFQTTESAFHDWARTCNRWLKVLIFRNRSGARRAIAPHLGIRRSLKFPLRKMGRLHNLELRPFPQFLQRVGGRYRFIHKLLQDHFAQMEFKRNVD
ncbi:hypothetical protein [Nostoc sp.]